MSDASDDRPNVGQNSPEVSPEAPGGGSAAANPGAGSNGGSGSASSRRRRRGNRGGRGRNRSSSGSGASNGGRTEGSSRSLSEQGTTTADSPDTGTVPESQKPKIGDTRPARDTGADAMAGPPSSDNQENRSGGGSGESAGGANRKRRRNRGRGGANRARSAGSVRPVEQGVGGDRIELDEETLESRRGRERKGRPIGRYSMCVHVGTDATQVAILEGRQLLEHYVSRPADDVSEINGNIYLGRVQNVLPGMEAAFVDIGTPKNAVLYRGDVRYDRDDVDESGELKIEQMLRNGQTILCQVTKNPIGAKGARLTQEVSIPGRFVVLVPNSSTFGISKRLSDDERRRLRNVLDRHRPAEHGIIVRTAAEHITEEEIALDITRLVDVWRRIEALVAKGQAPALLYREPTVELRVIREEFSNDYRSIQIDDPVLYADIRSYVEAVAPALAERVEYYDLAVEPLPLLERSHVHEQLHRALDRKVWLPSGGSLIIEHTEALTVIDVNTGKNVGRSSLEETVFANNLEAADEIARQLRLRDIGGIIVIDFIDMEIAENRAAVIKAFRSALSRDKTRTQVFNISELGLVEMTRKRIGEGLVESLSRVCPHCEGRGLLLERDLLGP